MEKKKMKKQKSNNKSVILITFLLASLALGACQSAAPSSATPLVGTTWLMQSYLDNSGQMAQAQPGGQATVKFTNDGNLSGNATCNQYAGTYQTSGDKMTIVLGPMTLMACSDDALNTQEQDFTKALGSTASYKIQGEQLTLFDQSGNTLLVFNAQKPDALVGPTWSAINYNNGKEAVVSVINGTEITAVFGSDGTLTGSASCNTYNATYQVNGDAITIGPAASTRMFCGEPAGLMDQEAAYLQALSMVKTYTVEGNRLTLFGENGNILVTYGSK
jgi:heat shock protein HslJ